MLVQLPTLSSHIASYDGNSPRSSNLQKTLLLMIAIFIAIIFIVIESLKGNGIYTKVKLFFNCTFHFRETACFQVCKNVEFRQKQKFNFHQEKDIQWVDFSRR